MRGKPEIYFLEIAQSGGLTQAAHFGRQGLCSAKWPTALLFCIVNVGHSYYTNRRYVLFTKYTLFQRAVLPALSQFTSS